MTFALYQPDIWWTVVRFNPYSNILEISLELMFCWMIFSHQRKYYLVHLMLFWTIDPDFKSYHKKLWMLLDHYQCNIHHPPHHSGEEEIVDGDGDRCWCCWYSSRNLSMVAQSFLPLLPFFGTFPSCVLMKMMLLMMMLLLLIQQWKSFNGCQVGVMFNIWQSATNQIHLCSQKKI